MNVSRKVSCSCNAPDEKAFLSLFSFFLFFIPFLLRFCFGAEPCTHTKTKQTTWIICLLFFFFLLGIASVCVCVCERHLPHVHHISVPSHLQPLLFCHSPSCTVTSHTFRSLIFLSFPLIHSLKHKKSKSWVRAHMNERAVLVQGFEPV